MWSGLERTLILQALGFGLGLRKVQHEPVGLMKLCLRRGLYIGKFVVLLQKSVKALETISPGLYRAWVLCSASPRPVPALDKRIIRQNMYSTLTKFRSDLLDANLDKLLIFIVQSVLSSISRATNFNGIELIVFISIVFSLTGKHFGNPVSVKTEKNRWICIKKFFEKEPVSEWVERQKAFEENGGTLNFVRC